MVEEEEIEAAEIAVVPKTQPKKTDMKFVLYSVVGIIVISIIIFTGRTIAEARIKNQPQVIVGPLEIVKEVPIKLGRDHMRVIVPTGGKRVTFKWESPTEEESEVQLSWIAHGPFGQDGGDRITSGWMGIYQFPSELEHDDVFFYTFVLHEGEDVQLTMKIWDSKVTIVYPEASP